MKVLISDCSIDNPFRGVSISIKNIISNLPKTCKIAYYNYAPKESPNTDPHVSRFIYEQQCLGNELKQQQADLVWFTRNNGVLFDCNHKKVSTIYDVIAIDRPDLQGGELCPSRDFLRLSRIIGALQSDLIIVPSLYTRDRLVALFNCPEERFRVIPLAADRGIFNTNPPTSKSAKKFSQILPKKYILSVGAYNKHKNFESLIKAYSKSIARKEGVKLVLVGPACDFTKGNLFPKLKELVNSLNLNNHVLFLTDYNHENGIEVIYKNALFFVNVSIYEGFGMPLVEAMSCGKAVISSTLTSQGEVVGDAALTVDPFNLPAVTGTIDSLLKSPKTVLALEEKSLQQAQKFNWQAIGLKHAEVFNECLQ